MGWGVFLAALAAYLVVRKRVNPRRGASVVSILKLVLLAIAGAGFAYTFLARWFAAVVGWITRLCTSLTGDDLTRAIPLAITVLVLLGVIADIAFDRVADRGALMGAFILPTLLLLVVGGQLGATGGDAVRASYAQVSAFLTMLGG